AHADHRLIGKDGVAAVAERPARDREIVERDMRHADADADIGNEGRAGAEIPRRVDHTVDDMDAARRIGVGAVERRAAEPCAETAIAVHLDRAHIVAREIETELHAELTELPAGGTARHVALFLLRAEIEAGRALAL